MMRLSSQVLLVAIVFIAAMLAPLVPRAFAEAPAAPPASTPAKVHAQDLPYYEACARQGLNASECAGRLIWFKATAGNERFHTYVFQQRVGVLIDWFRVLRSDERGDRFRAWGIINDPACCVPGSPDCPAKSLDETYGFDWCPGDEELLPHVGREGYRDPACDFRDAPLAAGDVHGPADQRHDACDLRFGTSTGALGIRKFPNPRFNRDAWLKLNGSTATWEGYNRPIAAAGGHGEAARSHLQDGAIEPPFLIGTSCGSCHIAFDPLNPPADPARPAWENIKGLVGNQYTRVSEIMVSGMASNTLEWQMFAHARPGTSDTSAIPTDQVNNPGTINALINLAKRPAFANESVIKWRKTTACAKGADEAKCWCEPGRDGKCWEKSLQKEAVHHILKGGEDSIGALEAIQRVYFNIGSCSEQCWVNHLADLRQLDPQQRGFGQTPFDIGQCRRDCPNFRAVEDRLANILDFFMSAEGHATDLRVARENTLRAADPGARYTDQDLIADLERQFGAGAVARGREVFTNGCARCHSSQPEAATGQLAGLDFHRLDLTAGLREDWLGNDGPTAVSEVGTFRCRALHSNHMAGHVWQEYGSETLRAQPPDPNVKEPGDGGRGYYRNLSLVNLWAHAPFLHNNALGPELCGKPQNAANDFYARRPRYVDASNVKLLPAERQPACFEYDPSVEARFKLYTLSMQALLNPAQRIPKVTLLNEDVTLRVGPRLWDGTEKERLLGFELTIPSEIDGRGVTAGTLGNFQHKAFIVDLVRAKTAAGELERSLNARLGKETGKKVLADLKAVAKEVAGKPNGLVEALRARPYLIKQVYSSCTAEVENEGHRFGEDLSEADKNALIAFLATL
ncbi:cytochrome c [Thauera sp.]|uniref:cytochrome c n=1 Tax=Thauera sp. TaxID=1905334 RepID=UPI002BA54C08|nr:cytochrome c [Thauera sp.]HRO36392.1 cytochrome c [Thauera sp.]